MNSLKYAIKDLTDSLKKASLWQNLGLLEVKQRYQRSILGPWWISISMLAFVLVLGAVFGRIFSEESSSYMPYFSSGYLLWLYVSSCLSEATDLFRQNGSFIKQINLPFSVYVLKFLTRNILIFFHNFFAFLIVFLFCQKSLTYVMFLAIPGFLLLTLNMYWMSFVIALISTRYRDLAPIVSSCVQILFFITPISWNKRLIGEHSKIVEWNPFVYLIESVREPLLGRVPSIETLGVCCLIGSVGMCFCFLVFSRFRTRIAFWVD